MYNPSIETSVATAQKEKTAGTVSQIFAQGIQMLRPRERF